MWTLLAAHLAITGAAGQQFTAQPIPFAAVSGDDLWLYGFSTFPQQIALDVHYAEQPGYNGYPAFQGEWSPDGNLFAYRQFNRSADAGLTFTDSALIVYDRRDGRRREVVRGLPADPLPFTFDLDSRALIFSRTPIFSVNYERLDLTDPASSPAPYLNVRADCGAVGGGGGGADDPAVLRYWAEVGYPFGHQAVQMTPAGLLYDLRCGGQIYGIINPQTGVATDLGVFRRAATSVTRTWAVGLDDAGRISRVNLTTLERTTLNNANVPDVLAVSRDGAQVYYTTRDEEDGSAAIYRYDVAAGSERAVYTTDAYAVGRLALTPDGRALIFSQIPGGDSPRTEIYQLDLTTEAASLIGRDMNSFAFNPVAYLSGFEGPVAYSAPTIDASALPTPAPDLTPIRRERLSTSNMGDLALIAVLARPGLSEALWSPGGRTLAVVAGSTVWLYDTADLDAAPRPLIHLAEVNDIAYNPDGQLLATSTEGAITIWRVLDGVARESVLMGAREIVYSPDGSLLAYSTSIGDVGWVNTLTRETRLLLRGEGPPAPVGLDFDRRGETLAVGMPDGIVRLYDVATATERATFGTPGVVSAEPNGQNPRDGLRFSDDGRALVAVDLASPRSLRVWSAGGDLMAGSTSNNATYYGAAVSTRAGLLAATLGDPLEPGEHRVVVSALAGDGPPPAVLVHPDARGVTFSTDGTLLASTGGGELRLWGAANGLPTVDQARGFSAMNLVAGCDTFGVAPPALSPFQTVSLVWSWYAADDALLRQHLDAARYRVTLDGVPITGWQYLTRPAPDSANDDDPTVYWYAPIGQIAAGAHTAAYELTWTRAISDGYGQFGPGTAVERDFASCAFVVG